MLMCEDRLPIFAACNKLYWSSLYPQGFGGRLNLMDLLISSLMAISDMASQYVKLAGFDRSGACTYTVITLAQLC